MHHPIHLHRTELPELPTSRTLTRRTIDLIKGNRCITIVTVVALIALIVGIVLAGSLSTTSTAVAGNGQMANPPTPYVTTNTVTTTSITMPLNATTTTYYINCVRLNQATTILSKYHMVTIIIYVLISLTNRFRRHG